jgi:hypothetical protein
VEKQVVFPQAFPQLLAYTTFFEKDDGEFSTTYTNIAAKPE